MEPKYIDTLEVENGLNSDIINVLENNFNLAKKEVKNFQSKFDGGSIYETANNVFTYLKENVKYKADGAEHQKIRLPARLLADGNGDCKSFALAACSIMSYYAPVMFRYTSYRNDPTPTHVYCVVLDESGNEIIIDPVWHSFNSEKQYKKKYDHKMKISTLAGLENDTIQLDTYTYNLVNELRKLKAGSEKGSKLYNYAVSELNRIYLEAEIASEAINGKLGDKIKSVVKRVTKSVKGVVKVAKKVNLAPVRNAFALLLAVNYRNLCNRIDAQIKAGKGDKIKDVWVNKFGGNWNKFLDHISKGKKKKPFFGSPKKKVNGIGEPVTLTAVGATIAAATPILLMIGKLIKPDTSGSDFTNPDNGDNIPPGKDDDWENVEDTSGGDSNLTPFLIGGGLLGAFLLLRK